jgi:hypothetical protein
MEKADVDRVVEAVQYAIDARIIGIEGKDIGLLPEVVAPDSDLVRFTSPKLSTWPGRPPDGSSAQTRVTMRLIYPCAAHGSWKSAKIAGCSCISTSRWVWIEEFE